MSSFAYFSSSAALSWMLSDELAGCEDHSNAILAALVLDPSCLALHRMSGRSTHPHPTRTLEAPLAFATGEDV
jgi:hypothetical protein